MTVGVPALTLPFALERAAPPFEGHDIKYPESLPRHFINLYTRKGQKVFDPFAGLGTTLFVAEELGRKAFGIEADRQRHEWTAGQLENWMGLRLGDSAAMKRMVLPKMDFCMTSPPFMPLTDRYNPLTGGNPVHAGYDRYLKRMALIFSHVTQVAKRGAKLVVHVDNIQGRRFTPLVRDIGVAVAQSWLQIDDVVVQGKNSAVYTHCLVFSNNLVKRKKDD